MEKPGQFITFEGPEGSGKSTQIQQLVEQLKAQDIEVISTREPGGTATGEAIRNILQHNAANEALSEHAELLLFAASRAQLVNQVIFPALQEGVWVICDRFIDSTMAYQGYARGMDLGILNQINKFAIAGCKPDLTLLLDLDVERGFRRLEERYADGKASADRFECEAREFHERVRSGYHQLSEREPERFYVIDADQCVDSVSSQIWDAVQKRLF